VEGSPLDGAGEGWLLALVLPIGGRRQQSRVRVEMDDRRLRIVVAKPGLDGHDRGAKIIARALRDGGFEVIYTGLHQTPEMIAETVVQEDADAVGLSVLSGAHMTLFPEVLKLLKEKGAEDVVVFGGGIIPQEDAAALKQVGVKAIFTPGATTEEIVKWVRENVTPSH
jgi:methylmalonyl-CoA mutase C-terminal domain/subunit